MAQTETKKKNLPLLITAGVLACAAIGAVFFGASGRGYYVANGGILICQNCGTRFTAEQVQTQAGGCNPYPIFAENKSETPETISISYDFLKQSASIFANWKIG